MIKSKNNFRRDRIIKENLLDYIDSIKISDRNKAIVKEYAIGKSYKELSKEHDITQNRIAQIVANYIYHANKYKKNAMSQSNTQ